MKEYLSGAQEMRCPQCGKRFVCWSVQEWCYKTERGEICCTWTCYRKRERMPQKPKHKYAEGTTRAPRTPVELRKEQARQIVEMRRNGYGNKEIASAMGITPSKVASRLFEFGGLYGWSSGREARP